MDSTRILSLLCETRSKVCCVTAVNNCSLSLSLSLSLSFSLSFSFLSLSSFLRSCCYPFIVFFSPASLSSPRSFSSIISSTRSVLAFCVRTSFLLAFSYSILSISYYVPAVDTILVLDSDRLIHEVQTGPRAPHGVVQVLELAKSGGVSSGVENK